MPETSVVELLAVQEETLEALYGTFAKRFPAQEALWSAMAAAEHLHAEQLRLLYDLLRSHHVSWGDRHFTAQTIASGQAHISQLLRRAEAGNITAREALTAAIGLETSLLERDYFRVFAPDSPRLVEVFRRLSQETREHLQTLREALAAL